MPAIKLRDAPGRRHRGPALPAARTLVAEGRQHLHAPVSERKILSLQENEPRMTPPAAGARATVHTGTLPDERQLGRVLRGARARAGLTLQEVAQAAGISTSALSKIENGQVEVKFATLMRLSAALSLSLDNLTALPPPSRVAGARVVTRRDAAVPHSNAEYDYGLLGAELAAKTMLPSVITIKARGIDEFAEWNRHAGEELVYVLRGRVRLYMDGYEPVLLETGDSAYYDSSVGHALVSVGRQSAQVLSVASEAGGAGPASGAGGPRPTVRPGPPSRTRKRE